MKTLEAAFPGKGRELRRALESALYVREHPVAVEYARQCHNTPPLHVLRLKVLDAILEGHGIELAMPAGKTNDDLLRGMPKGSFEYVNMGDPYVTTIVRFANGRYRVACYGDIVERGGYA